MLKRILYASLASLMLIGSLASCAESNDNKGDQTGAVTTPNAANESDTRETLDIPTKKYDGAEITFLTRDESEWSTLEIFSEGMTSESDNINNAVYERNVLIEETYDVNISELKEKTDTHIDRINQEISGKSGDFQAIITNTSQSASLSAQGKLWNLNHEAVEHIDLTKSWWDRNMAEGLSIHDRVYFATGDLLTADNDATFVILFNKQILADNQLPDLYSLVENQEWTMEKFYEFASKSVRNLDGQDGISYDNDIAGFAYTGDSPYCFLFGGGITLTTKNADDEPIYQLNVDRAQSISEMGKKLFDKTFAVDLNAVTNNGGPVIMEVGKTCFGEGHSLFLGEVMQAVTRMRGYDVDFGILPYPMFSTDQDNYYSMMHLTASMVSIPLSVTGDELAMTSAIIEAMAYHSIDTLTEQYYEINLKTKGAKDEKSGPMIDKILSSRACDLSYYYQWCANAFGKIAGTLLPTDGGSISSLNKQFSKKMGKEIDKVIEDMDKAAEEVDKSLDGI